MPVLLSFIALALFSGPCDGFVYFILLVLVSTLGWSLKKFIYFCNSAFFEDQTSTLTFSANGRSAPLPADIFVSLPDPVSFVLSTAPESND